MKIKMHHGVNNETWREHCQDIEDDFDQQNAADDLRDKTENILLDLGHDIQTAYQQSRGIGVVCQTPDADEIVFDAMQKSKKLME